jgi:truncated hemoglobin YjbI
MWEDPIVAEVHRTREKLAAEHSFDIGAFFAGVRKRQAAWGERLVHQRKQAEPMTETTSITDNSSSRSALEEEPN